MHRINKLSIILKVCEGGLGGGGDLGWGLNVCVRVHQALSRPIVIFAISFNFISNGVHKPVCIS